MKYFECSTKVDQWYLFLKENWYETSKFPFKALKFDIIGFSSRKYKDYVLDKATNSNEIIKLWDVWITNNKLKGQGHSD